MNSIHSNIAEISRRELHSIQRDIRSLHLQIDGRNNFLSTILIRSIEERTRLQELEDGMAAVREVARTQFVEVFSFT